MAERRIGTASWPWASSPPLSARSLSHQTRYLNELRGGDDVVQPTPSREKLGGRFSRSAAAPSGSSCPLKPRNSMPSEASKMGPAAGRQLLRADFVPRMAVG